MYQQASANPTAENPINEQTGDEKKKEEGPIEGEFTEKK